MTIPQQCGIVMQIAATQKLSEDTRRNKSSAVRQLLPVTALLNLMSQVKVRTLLGAASLLFNTAAHDSALAAHTGPTWRNISMRNSPTAVLINRYCMFASISTAAESTLELSVNSGATSRHSPSMNILLASRIKI